MIFKKLALATAITTLPLAGFAMTEVTDEVLSDVTGQDGIAISINAPSITSDIILHDRDGIPAGEQAGYANAGAIVITGFGLNTNGGAITVGVDAGDATAVGIDNTTPTMHIAVSIPANTVITTGAISVANSQRDPVPTGWDIEAGTQTATLLSSMTITLNGVTNMDIQLGNEPQGNMIQMNTTITGGLTLSGLALNDAKGPVTGGALGAVSVLVQNAGGTDLGVQVGMDATAAGLVINLTQLGAGTGIDVKIEDAYLGSSALPIGDVYIKNLDIDGTTVTIAGK